MLTPPRPAPPYWPAYPEPERSRIEAAYRVEEARWQREAGRIATLNLILALIGPAMVAAAAIGLVGLLP